MATYLVQLPDNQPSQVLQDGCNAIIVIAASTAQAKAMAKAAFGADVNGPWDGATVTDLVLTSGDDWGQPYTYTLNVRVFDDSGEPLDDNADGATIVTNGSTADTADEIGALFVTAIEAAYPSIQGAAYDASTNVLTIAAADGDDDDDIGDHTVVVSCKVSLTGQVVDSGIEIPGFFGTIVHEQTAADLLSVALPGDAVAIPRVLARVKV